MADSYRPNVPPRKIQPQTQNRNTTSSVLPPQLSEFAGTPIVADTKGVFELPQLEIAHEYDAYVTCLKHGKLTGNLCERCLAWMVGGDEKPKRPEGPTIWAAIFAVATSPTVVAIFKGLLFCLSWIAQVIGSCIVCFALMWFVQPSMKPAEQRRRELDDERRKKEDNAWFARRDAEWERSRSEQHAWEDERDEAYRKKVEDQIAWEKKCGEDYRKKVEDQIAWEKKREEGYRNKVDEYDKWKKDEDERYRKAVLEEFKSLGDKVTNNDGDPENDLRRLEDVGRELRSLVNEKNDTPGGSKVSDEKRDEEKIVDRKVEQAADRKEGDAVSQWNKVVTDWNDPNTWNSSDGSGIARIKKSAEDASTSWEDSEKFRKRQKKS